MTGEPKRIGAKCITCPYPATGLMGSAGHLAGEIVTFVHPVCSRCERKFVSDPFNTDFHIDFTEAYEDWVIQRVLRQ